MLHLLHCFINCTEAPTHQPSTLAKPMPWNRDRPFDRETKTPRDPMATLSIRLVPGRCEFA